MSFGQYRNSGISWFRDYGDALHKYENTTDIRGRVEEPKRPLGHRKAVDNYSIRKADNGDIECVLYKTPVVTFHTDGTVSLRAGGWASQTTANFIPEVLGYGVCARVFNHKLCLTIHGNEYFMDREEPFKIGKDENDAWQPLNAKQLFVHNIKRKESNIVIRKYAEVFKYLESMRKLRDDGMNALFSKEEIEACFGEPKDNYSRRLDITLNGHHATEHKLYADFKTWIDDKSEDKHLSYYKALLVLVNTVGHFTWGNEDRRMQSHHWLEAKNVLKNMIWGFHRDEVFTPIAVQAGYVRKDTYGRFFEGAWEKYHEELSALSSAQTLDNGI